ncbi:unnamed protein product [Sphagnum jensenii]
MLVQSSCNLPSHNFFRPTSLEAFTEDNSGCADGVVYECAKASPPSSEHRWGRSTRPSSAYRTHGQSVRCLPANSSCVGFLNEASYYNKLRSSRQSFRGGDCSTHPRHILPVVLYFGVQFQRGLACVTFIASAFFALREEIKKRLNAVSQLKVIATALGSERTRNELVPFLNGALEVLMGILKRMDLKKSEEFVVDSIKKLVESDSIGGKESGIGLLAGLLR